MTFRHCDRYDPDVNAERPLTVAEEWRAVQEQLEWNAPIECAHGRIEALEAELRIQAKGHQGDWSEVFNALDYAKSALPERK